MTMQGSISKLDQAEYFDDDGIRMRRHYLTMGDRQLKLELRESARLGLTVGDEVILELAADGVMVTSIYNRHTDQGHGTRWKRLKRSLGPWAGTRVIRGTVKHKERNRSRDDLSREGYHTVVYFVIELEDGVRFLLDERAGTPVRPGHRVEALVGRGGRDEFDTLAFRDLTAGTDSMPSPWPARVALIASLVTIGFLVQVVRTHVMDGPRWFMLLLILAVPGGLWWMFATRRWKSRRALDRLTAAAHAA